MRKVNEDEIIVSYKYAIEMPIIRKSLSEFRKSILKKENQFLSNKSLLLISPLAYSKDKKTVYIEPVFDIDLKQEYKFNSNYIPPVEIYNLIIDVCKKYNMHFIYTGRLGFHIYSKDIFIVNPYSFKNDIKELRQYIISKYPYLLIKLKKFIDIYYSGATSVPIIRIGYRNETNRIVFPIVNLNLSYNQFKKIISKNSLRYALRLQNITFYDYITSYVYGFDKIAQ